MSPLCELLLYLPLLLEWEELRRRVLSKRLSLLDSLRASSLPVSGAFSMGRTSSMSALLLSGLMLPRGSFSAATEHANTSTRRVFIIVMVLRKKVATALTSEM